MVTESQREAQRKYMLEWRAANKGRIAEYQKKWRSENPDKCRGYDAKRSKTENRRLYERKRSVARKEYMRKYRTAYYRKNRERIAAQNRQWAIEHQDQSRAIKQRHYQRQVSMSIWAAMREIAITVKETTHAN